MTKGLVHLTGSGSIFVIAWSCGDESTLVLGFGGEVWDAETGVVVTLAV